MKFFSSARWRTAHVRRIAEVGKFLAVSAVNTIATYLLYLGLLNLVEYRIAYSISYISGIALSYVLNARYVFARRMTWSSALRFPLVYLVQYVIGLVVLTVLVQRIHLPASLAALVLVAVSVPITFLLSRLIIRRAPAI